MFMSYMSKQKGKEGDREHGAQAWMQRLLGGRGPRAGQRSLVFG